MIHSLSEARRVTLQLSSRTLRELVNLRDRLLTEEPRRDAVLGILDAVLDQKIAAEVAPLTLEPLSVCQFFEDGSSEYVRRHVSMDEASKAFVHYTTSVAARLGFTQRVIITDGGDSIVAEWKKGEGTVFPLAPNA